MLHYAETHFKFPVSRLYRKEPVILEDAPFQICPGTDCPVWLIVRKAHLFPVFIEEVFGEWFNEDGQKIKFKLPIQQEFKGKFHFKELDIEKPTTKQTWMLKVFVKYNNKICERWNYPYLEPKPLTINFLKEMPPKPEGSLAAEMHCHSSYTSDSVEFGAAPEVLQKAAKSVGLDLVFITDHSYDLLNETKFQKLKNETKDMKGVIVGEEVSCGNAKNQNVHLLVYKNENYIEGHGDGGRRWWNFNPDLTIAEAIGKCGGTMCVAAHPKLQMLIMEKLLLKRGHWSYKDLTQNKIDGIEFWNGYRGKDFYEGRELWIKCLLAGYRYLPIGGNDAHGDLNSYTSVKKPLWNLKCNDEHIFGKVRTVFYGKDLYITDGPALWFENGKLHAKTNEDMGNFLSITLFFGKKEETTLALNVNETEFEIPKNDSDYVRAECETTLGKFAMTAACFSQRV